MAELPPFPHYTSVEKILKSVANFPGEHVEEVFQEFAIMPLISSVILDQMLGLLFNMFEDIRDVFVPARRGQTPHGEAPKPWCKPPIGQDNRHVTNLKSLMIFGPKRRGS